VRAAELLCPADHLVDGEAQRLTTFVELTDVAIQLLSNSYKIVQAVVARWAARDVRSL
jgi:hypothetical protein